MPVNAAVTRSFYQYQSDDGTIYRMLVADYIAAQVGTGSSSLIGATAATGSEPRWRGGRLRRRAVVRDLTNKRDYEIPILTPTAPLVAVGHPSGNTIALNGHAGNQVTCTYQGHLMTETSRGIH